MALIKPIGCRARHYLPLKSLRAVLIELLLPFGIAPTVDIFHKWGIPKAMQLSLLAKVGNIGLIAAQITQTTCMHRCVNITHKVNQELKVYSLLLRCKFTTLKFSPYLMPG